jgi:aarF domain-containing kinase
MLRGSSGRPTRRFPVVLNSATSSTAASFSTSAADARQAQKRIEQVQELLQETVRLTLQTGPKGFFRSVQVAEAVLSLAQETLQQGYVDPPEAVLRKLFEKLGATYIKLGQFIASSPSIFPDEYVTEFQKCLDKAEPVPFDAIKQIIREELQQPLEEVFTYIDPKPLATASIAQVHTAILKNSNKEVVIKVLKPGVEDVLQTDLNFIYLMTRYLEFIQPELERLSVTPILGKQLHHAALA